MLSLAVARGQSVKGCLRPKNSEQLPWCCVLFVCGLRGGALFGGSVEYLDLVKGKGAIREVI